MKKFKIGDEEYSEEINTTYDQNQIIGDEPQALNSEWSNSEPIDAKTGQDFLDIDLGEEKFKSRKQQQWYHATDQSYLDDEPHENRKVVGETTPINQLTNSELLDKREYMYGLGQSMGYLTQIEEEMRTRGIGGINWHKEDKKEFEGESLNWKDVYSSLDLTRNAVEDQDAVFKKCMLCGKLFTIDNSWSDNEMENHVKDEHAYALESLNKDGTGVKHATRGVNPNDPKYDLLKFIYVSKSDCPICKQYDGKVYHKDDPDRPIIPRLESGYSAGKGYAGSNFTHPHCKCKWTYVFNKSGEAIANEFDLIDPVPFASMAKLAYDAIKPTIMNKLGIAEEIQQSTIDRTKKIYGDGWDKLNIIQQEKLMVDMLSKAVEVMKKIDCDKCDEEFWYDDYDDNSIDEARRQRDFHYTKEHASNSLAFEEFKEDEHPRDDDGKFGSGGSSKNEETTKLQNDIDNVLQKAWDLGEDGKTRTIGVSEDALGVNLSPDYITNEPNPKFKVKPSSDLISNDFDDTRLDERSAYHLMTMAFNKKYAVGRTTTVSDNDKYRPTKFWIESYKSMQVRSEYETDYSTAENTYTYTPEWSYRLTLHKSKRNPRTESQLFTQKNIDDAIIKLRTLEKFNSFTELESLEDTMLIGRKSVDVVGSVAGKLADELEYLKNIKAEESIAFEGGKGSGRRGHQKWMLTGEVGDMCDVCMIITDRNDDGNCILCGN